MVDDVAVVSEHRGVCIRPLSRSAMVLRPPLSGVDYELLAARSCSHVIVIILECRREPGFEPICKAAAWSSKLWGEMLAPMNTNTIDSV